MRLNKYKLGDYIELIDKRNDDNKYELNSVVGLSTQKQIIRTKADLDGVNLSSYKLFEPETFAYVPDTSRRGDKISLVYNNQNETFLVSSISCLFKVIENSPLLPEFLFMYFNRPEFDRYTRFHSWGSARETFDWSEMCDLEITLPSLAIQQKYVNIYQAMLANQQSYERSLEDLKLICDIELEKIKYITTKFSFGELLEEIDIRNEEGNIKNIQGIDIKKTFIPSTVNFNTVNIKNYKIVQKNQFAYSSMQTGRDKCIRIALYNKDNPIIISPAYSVLQVKNKKTIPEYLMLWFMREETDRYGWFASDGSIRASLELERFFQMQIPLPDMKIQQAIVDIYNCYIQRKEINEKLKTQLKNICPILIKGALEETNNE